ncbi:MAG TPA: von Willebrand factor type A domain-containing protein [Nannocystaceae bacterium]|nr:von Willebrand factor type A domain-containing protein [Nannocystaceae bacterium]
MPRRILGVFQLAALTLCSLPGCGSPAAPEQNVGAPASDAAIAGSPTAAGAKADERTRSAPQQVAQSEVAKHEAAPGDEREATPTEEPAPPPADPATAVTATPMSPVPATKPKASGGMAMPARKDSVARGRWGGPTIAADDGLSGESYEHVEENKFVAVADDPRSTFSIDVDTASYSNMRRFLNDNTLPPADAVRIEELINYFDYDYAAPEGSAPFSMTHEVSSCPWNDDHLLVHVGLQGKVIAERDVPARNLVFLLDVSGSMNSADKLPLLKRGLGMLVDNLRKEDRVSIVVYAGASGLVLEPTGDKAEILSALDRLESGGSTNGGAGIELAYRLAEKTFVKGGINRVILATDGDFNVGTTSQSELVKMIEDKRKSGVFLSVLGFGTGNVKDSTMEKLADKGNGNYAYIDSVGEARKVLVKEAGSTLVTIAKDVKIQVEFNPKEVASFRLVGYENRKLAHTDFNDDTKDAGEIGAGHSVTALYEVVPVGAKDASKSGLDPLKYQDEVPAAKLSSAAGSGELMNVKIRYKQPDGDKSDLLTFAITPDDRALDKTTDDFRFSAAVAELGLLLRGSQHKGDASFDEVLELARKSLGKDGEGHRNEFVALVEKAKRLSGGRVAVRGE